MSYRSIKNLLPMSFLVLPIGISVVSFLILNLVLPRYVDTETFAKFRALLIFIGLSGIIHLGIADGMFYFFTSIRRIVISRFKFILLILMLIGNSVLFSTFVEFYFKFSVNFVILFLSIFFVGSSTIFVQFGAVVLNTVKYSAFVVIQPIFSSVLCLIGLSIRVDATVFMLLYCSGFLLQTLAFFLFRPPYFLVERDEFSLRSFLGSKYNGFYSLIGEIAFIVFLNIDKLILFHLLKSKDFSAYSIAFVTISAFRAVLGSVINLVIAKNLIGNKIYIYSIFSLSSLIAFSSFFFSSKINTLFELIFPLYKSYNYSVFLYGTAMMSIIFLILIPLIKRFETSSYIRINLFSSAILLVLYFIEGVNVNFDVAVKIYLIGLAVWIVNSLFIINSKKTLSKIKALL